MKIALLGSGVVAQSLAAGYLRHGHEVVIGTRQAVAAIDGVRAQPFADAALWAELAVLAVKGEVAEELAGRLATELAGKILIDATNPLDFSSGAPQLFVGWQDSLGERVARAAAACRVVKAYNTVGNSRMVDPDLPGGPPTMFIAGDDEAAKATVTELLHATGWGVADVGGIAASRYLEPLCLTWVAIGMKSGSWDHAFKLLVADGGSA
ncbi:MAG: NAD(P)-binding domain-containing protein [Actinomycetota bacterium]|nr:NAD(P)-binding domain-containing protein [Actinomycetota bacterium]